jgi:tetratricopeptide (TPR) repeat protein
MTSHLRGRTRRLSVAIIARDEQDVLAATMESVRSMADEIVVLDTGSTDQTPVLAAEWGAKVCRTNWKDDFSIARNRLLEEVTGDWILWLDAGEQLTAETAAELRSFIDTVADPRRVYLLVVELPAADPHASSEQAAQPRLMPGQPGLWFSGRVAESLMPSIERLGLALDATACRILRHPRNNREDVKAAKARRNLRLIELANAACGEISARLRIVEGEAHQALGNQEAARRAFRQAVELAPRNSTELLEAYYGLLTTFEGEPGQQNQQMAVCLEALELYPLDVQLLAAMGGYLQNQNRLDLATRAFDLALKHGQINPETWHLCEIFEIAAVCLSVLLQLQGKHEEARQALEGGLQRSPRSRRIRRQLVDLYAHLGRDAEAQRLVEGLADSPAERASLLNVVRGACEATRQNWTQALGYLQSAYLAGCRDALGLRWLTFTLLSNGQIEAAEPVLRQWLEREPNSPEALAYREAINLHAGEDTVLEGLSTSRYFRVDAAQGLSTSDTISNSVLDCLAPNTDPEWTG